MAQKFLNILVVAIALLMSPQASAEDLKAEVHLTFQYQGVDGSADFNPFYYPNLGFSFQDTYIDLQVDSMMPIVIVDGVASLINFLAGGDGLLLFEGLNGKEDPGRMVLMEGRVRYNFFRADNLKLGTGLGMEYVWFGPYFGKRMTLTSVNVDAHIGMTLDLGNTEVLGIIRAGNGWTEYANFDPLMGTSLQIRTQIYDALSALIRLNAGMQYFDTTNWTEPYINSGIDPDGARFEEWVKFWGVEAGLSVGF